jgi:site-specific recombinase XerD
MEGSNFMHDVQQEFILGHDRLTTTEIYVNLSPEDVLREFREKW